MIATKDTHVTINYNFKTTDGVSLGSSEDDGPFSFILGRGDVMPGLDTNLEGAKVGDKLSFVVPADEAYGQRREDLVFTMPRDHFKDIKELRTGLKVQSTMEGRPVELTVVELGNDQVTLDGNHPLAGFDIAFDVDIVNVETVPEELLNVPSHGCGCGGNCSCGSH